MRSIIIRLNEFQIAIIKIALKYLQLDLKDINGKLSDEFNVQCVDIDKILRKLDD